MTGARGVLNRRIDETPLAVLDLETTGLIPGHDRVVEVSVVHVDPGQEPRLVLDTLVNPMRRMAATEIHGITEEDVAHAPRFPEIAGALVGALSGRVVAAYNVYFDMRFLGLEFQSAGVDHQPPHLCLMYLRPMLGLGARCKLDEACRLLGIAHEVQHVAGHDALASSKLWTRYHQIMRERGVATYADLAKLRSYKFVESFENAPLPPPSNFKLPPCDRLCSRSGHVQATVVDQARGALASYWDTLTTVVADLEITEEELAEALNERIRLGLKDEQIRAIHAKALASVLAQFAQDQWLDDREARKLDRLYHCLARLGWAPGQ
jgi:DNA polymerase-3 subunit epsilon